MLIATSATVAACVLALAAGVGSALAAFPGANGKIVFSSLSDWGDSDVFVVNPDGSGLVNLTNYGFDDDAPAFSPDGSRIAFTSDRDGNAEIYVMDADGANVTRLTDDTAGDFGPAFSADGRRVAFTSDRDGNLEIYSVALDGSGVTRLTDNPAADFGPAFSADGSRLAFTSERDGNREIYVAAADAGDPGRLTFDAAADYGPNFSPDGARIAFVNEPAGGPARVYVMRADGSSRALLTSDERSSDHNPVFSPDGTRVAFAGDSYCPPGYGCGQILGGALYVTSSDGSMGRTAVSPGMPLADPDWGVATPGGGPPDPAPGPSPPDTTPPETIIGAGPTGATGDATPTFGFDGTDDRTATARLQYSYRLDQGAWSSYTGDTSATLSVSDGAHTIYVRARDEAGNQDPTPAERSFTVDTVAPSGTVTIQGGALQTRTARVTLTLSAGDPAPATGVTAMRISNAAGGLSSAPWAPYATTTQWTLTTGAGTKTVYVQYRDAAENVSPVAQDTIRYKP